jgi:ribosomal protein RSM22 (predicted rRNA methylase)
MELPPALREAVEEVLAGVAVPALAEAAERLSQRYRAELRDGRWHVADELAAQAYLATRLPATYAAIRASLGQVALAAPDFAPQSLLDVGAGPGSAWWAASDCWPGLHGPRGSARLIEGSPAMRGIGQRLLALAAPDAGQIHWQAADLLAGLPDLAPHDLVTLAYVQGELASPAREALLARLWALTAGTLLLVEPGTPAGWQRLMQARSQLLAAGASLLAPCPHAADCPIVVPDWCHFSRKVARSRLHRLVKRADVPWEDEKFCYLAVARQPASAAITAKITARVLAAPHAASGRVSLKLCQSDGSAMLRLFTKREGEVYKSARRLDWGDGM